MCRQNSTDAAGAAIPSLTALLVRRLAAARITDEIFHDEAAAQAHIEGSRWRDRNPVCPFCGSGRVRRMKGKTQAGMFLCNECREKFTVRTGTAMERSHVPLHKWLLAMHLMGASANAVSARQMERMLGVTYKTAWFLRHRIRAALGETFAEGPVAGPSNLVDGREAFVSRNKPQRTASAVKHPSADCVPASHETVGVNGGAVDRLRKSG